MAQFLESPDGDKSSARLLLFGVFIIVFIAWLLIAISTKVLPEIPQTIKELLFSLLAVVYLQKVTVENGLFASIINKNKES